MYEELKKEIADVMRYIEEKGWNHGRAGNASVLVRETGHLLITPSGVAKSRLRPSDILVLDVSGRILEGSGKPSSELPMHLEIYRNYGDVGAVLHAHGVYSTVLAITRTPLPVLIDEMRLVLGGDIRVADYAPFGTVELARNVAEALRDRRAVIIANHGVLAVGRDIWEAVEALGLVERLSQSYVLGRIMGKVYTLE